MRHSKVLSRWLYASLLTHADVVASLNDMIRSIVPPKGREFDVRYLFLGGDAAAGMFKNTFGHASILISRDLLVQTGGYQQFTPYCGWEDWEFFLSLSLSHTGTIRVIPESPIYYRVTGTNNMMKTTNFSLNLERLARPLIRYGVPEMSKRWAFSSWTAERCQAMSQKECVWFVLNRHFRPP
jgi:hypothetical protein